jgi:uncharacterized YigZ family protein
MENVPRYPAPSSTRRVEDVIDRSRFITTVGPAATVEDARRFLDRVREEFPDATHNCWAYVIGPPGDTSRVGMSDAGEPHGTAGRPMLAVLLRSGIGDVVAVVTRYYGGRNLGKGGLVRAYSGGVKSALDGLPLVEQMRAEGLRVALDYPDEAPLRNLLPDFEAKILTATHGTAVSFTLELPSDRVDDFVLAVSGLTNGRARVTKVDDTTGPDL